MSGIADFVPSDALDLYVTKVEYTDDGGVPTIHLYGRDPEGIHHEVAIEGHRPSFWIRQSEYDTSISNHYAVVDVEGGYEDIHGERLVRVYTEIPSQVSDMRDLFDRTYEADVFYNIRWLVDSGIGTGARIDGEPDENGVYHVDDVEPIDAPDVRPRMVVTDIEVASDEGVPDPTEAPKPVTTIVSWDSYTERYVGWLLEDAEHDEVPDSHEDLDELRTFVSESNMLDDYNRWLTKTEPDLLSGWFSDKFDYPYLISRCRGLNTYSYKDWSPLGEVFISTYFDDPHAVVKGVTMFDMLEGYKKTQYRNLDSKKLDDVAADELDGYSKVELETDHTQMWLDDPYEFLSYNQRDVELVHEIEQAQSIVDLFMEIREVAGCPFDECHASIDTIDVLMLREARKEGFVLPTAVKPEQDWYYGAEVLETTAGLHDHVVYPDYSSLYPYAMLMCNISPETIVGTEDELEASEYTKDECCWSYIDTRPVSVKENSDPEYEKCYYTDGDRGFVSGVIGRLMDLTRGTTGKRREALKRVRNAVYGVQGDSASYGKGFRLYDWRLAESTTLAGRKILLEGADRFVEEIEDPEATIVGGDTDSFMTSLPSASDGRDAVRMASAAVDNVNAGLQPWGRDEFGLDHVDDVHIDLELESYASRCFFAYKRGTTETGKKRYVTMIEYEDGEWLDEPELNIKGFEYVRSDVAQITKQLQADVFRIMMSAPYDELEQRMSERLRSAVNGVLNGEVDDAFVAKPFAASQQLSEYGSADKRPGPSYRGAKYANEYIYGADAIGSGADALWWYVDEVDSDGRLSSGLPKTYSADTAEDGDYVDAVTVLDARDLPDSVIIDRKKMVQKTIVDPMESIFRTLDMDIEDALPAAYFRSRGQSGMDQFVTDMSDAM